MPAACFAMPSLALRNSVDVRDDARRRSSTLPDEPIWYDGDETELRQVLWSLGTNGLRAMPNGGRAAHVGSARAGRGADGRSWCSRSLISGCGIPSEQLDDVFQPFHSSFRKGAGLGLAIVHRIVTDYGGRIQVSSTVGEGTTVSVRLPIAAAVRRRRPHVTAAGEDGMSRAGRRRAEGAARTCRSRATPPASSSSTTSRRCVTCCASCCAADGYEVLTADGGRAALGHPRARACRSAAVGHPHVGCQWRRGAEEAAKELNRDVVVFMMTAFASTDTAVEAMRLGAVDYFTKPFSMDELRLKIRQHLESSRLKQENVLLKRALNTTPRVLEHHRPQQRHARRVPDDRDDCQNEQHRARSPASRAPARSWSRAPFTSTRCAAIIRSWR